VVFANANQIIFYRAPGRCKQRPSRGLIKDLHLQFLKSVVDLYAFPGDSASPAASLHPAVTGLSSGREFGA
jgi:hypothetical protein